MAKKNEKEGGDELIVEIPKLVKLVFAEGKNMKQYHGHDDVMKLPVHAMKNGDAVHVSSVKAKQLLADFPENFSASKAKADDKE